MSFFKTIPKPPANQPPLRKFINRLRDFLVFKVILVKLFFAFIRTYLLIYNVISAYDTLLTFADKTSRLLHSVARKNPNYPHLPALLKNPHLL